MPRARRATVRRNVARARRASASAWMIRIKEMVARAAGLERRGLTDFCLTALSEAARQTIARHQTLVLSARDRQAFFDALIHPPKANARLQRAFKGERERIAP